MKKAQITKVGSSSGSNNRSPLFKWLTNSKALTVFLSLTFTFLTFGCGKDYDIILNEDNDLVFGHDDTFYNTTCSGIFDGYVDTNDDGTADRYCKNNPQD